MKGDDPCDFKEYRKFENEFDLLRYVARHLLT